MLRRTPSFRGWRVLLGGLAFLAIADARAEEKPPATPAALWSGTWVGNGKMYDFGTRKTEHFGAPSDSVEMGALSPDGRWLALVAAKSSGGGFPRWIELFDRKAGTRRQLLRVGGVAGVEWSPDGRYLWIGAVEVGRAWLLRPDRDLAWSVPRGDLLADPACASASIVEYKFSEDAAGRSVLTLYQYRNATDRRLWRKINGVLKGVLSPTNQMIAFTGDEGDLWVQNLASGFRRRFTKTRDRQELVQFWSPDGQWIVALEITGVDDSGRFAAWNVASGKKQNLPATHAEAGKVAGSDIQWWSADRQSDSDCTPWVEKTFGAGQKLTLDKDGYPPGGRL